MPAYLLSVHRPDAPPAGGAPQTPPTPEQMDAMMAPIRALEEDLAAAGAWVFSGHLQGVDAARVVRAGDETVVTDGPFAEAKEHVAGFYVIEAADDDAALEWATRTSATVGMPIELRPFGGTGRA